MYEYYERLKTYAIYIYVLYKKLARLELEYKTKTKEYEDTIELINKLKKKEEEIYSEIKAENNEKLPLAISIVASQDLLGKNFNTNTSIFDTSYLFSDKIKNIDVVPMRISYKLIDIFRHQYIKDNATFNIYDTYTPIRDKHFLDVLTEQINDIKYKEFRKLLIDAKYDYAFVNSKDVQELKEYDEEKEENENLDVIATLGAILEYKEKFKKLNLKTLQNPKNQRRLILDVNYIRANALSVPDYQIMAVQDMIKNEDETLTDGTKFFLNVLNLALEDKNKFEEGDIPYIRKF